MNFPEDILCSTGPKLTGLAGLILWLGSHLQNIPLPGLLPTFPA